MSTENISTTSVTAQTSQMPTAPTIPRTLPPYKNLVEELRDIDSSIQETLAAKGTPGYLGKLYATGLLLYTGNWIEWLWLDNITQNLKTFIANVLGNLIKDDYQELHDLMDKSPQRFESPKELFTSVYLAGCNQLLAHTHLSSETTNELNQRSIRYGYVSVNDEHLLNTKRWLEDRAVTQANLAETNTYDYNAATLLFILIENPILIESKESVNRRLSFNAEEKGNVVDNRFVDNSLYTPLRDRALKMGHPGILSNTLELAISFSDHDTADDAAYIESHIAKAQKLIDAQYVKGHIFMGRLLNEKAHLDGYTDDETNALLDQALIHFLKAYELGHPEAYGYLSKIYNGILLDGRFYAPATALKVLEEGERFGLEMTPFYLLHTLLNLHDCPTHYVERILGDQRLDTESPKGMLVKNLLNLRLYSDHPTPDHKPPLIADVLRDFKIVTTDPIQNILFLNEPLPIEDLQKTVYFMIWNAYDSITKTAGTPRLNVPEIAAFKALVNAGALGHMAAQAELLIFENLTGLKVNTQGYFPIREIGAPMTLPQFVPFQSAEEFLKFQMNQMRLTTKDTRKITTFSALSFAMGFDQPMRETMALNTGAGFRLTIPPIRAHHLRHCFDYAYAVKRLGEMQGAPQTVVNLNTLQNDPYHHLYAQASPPPMTAEAWTNLQNNLSNLLQMDDREKNLKDRFFNFIQQDINGDALKNRLQKVYSQLLPMPDQGKRKALACVLMLDGGQACINRALEALSHVESELAKELGEGFNNALPTFIAKLLAQVRSRTAADITLDPIHDQNVEERRYYRIILEPFICPEFQEPNLEYHQAAIKCYGPTHAYSYFLEKLTADLYINEVYEALKSKLKFIATDLEANPPADLKAQLDQAITPLEKQRLIWEYFASEDYDDLRRDFVEKLLIQLKYLSASPYY